MDGIKRLNSVLIEGTMSMLDGELFLQCDELTVQVLVPYAPLRLLVVKRLERKRCEMRIVGSLVKVDTSIMLNAEHIDFRLGEQEV